MSRYRITVAALALGTIAVFSTGCKPEEESNHGFAKIQLLRAGNMDHSPFGGTASVKAQVRYGDSTSQCLVEFYRTNPNWRVDGLDGGPVFEKWEEKVCESQDNDDSISCEKAEITQTGLDDADDIPHLMINYNVSGSDLENHVLIIGPLPTPELANCDGGALPTVSFQASGITGNGSDDQPIWRGSSAPEDKAYTNQGLTMKVRVAEE